MPQEVLAARRTHATQPPPPREASLPAPVPSTEAVRPDTVAPGATPARAGAAPAGPDPLVGQKVGSFMVQRLLGKGGMGTVYLAEHPVIGSKVAIKFLHESLGDEPQTVARFYDEAKAVNLIGHENIVGIYDLNLLPPNRYYYVMEYLEGSTLAALEKQGRLPVKVQLDVLNQLCDALQRAHERGVVHRDLKPENVFLVQRRGKAHFVKLVDFGIAKLRGAAGASRVTGRTEAGVIIGTPEYMAPEQCEDGTIDARTDVYALGVMAFEMATGRLPFGGRSVTQLLLAHLQKKPPRPSELAPVEASLERAILRALEKDPAARFQDMASSRRRCGTCRASRAARRLRPSSRRSWPPPSRRSRRGSPPPRPRRRHRRRPRSPPPRRPRPRSRRCPPRPSSRPRCGPATRRRWRCPSPRSPAPDSSSGPRRACHRSCRGCSSPSRTPRCAARWSSPGRSCATSRPSRRRPGRCCPATRSSSWTPPPRRAR
ncbi:MAG: serine/threonine-protein kinase [Anaeromyxobacter sp.]